MVPDGFAGQCRAAHHSPAAGRVCLALSQSVTEMTSFTKRNLLVLALYTALALVLTYPLVLHFGDAVPGTTTWSMDEYGYVWNNWWFKHAVLDLGTNPF